MVPTSACARAAAAPLALLIALGPAAAQNAPAGPAPQVQAVPAPTQAPVPLPVPVQAAPAAAQPAPELRKEAPARKAEPAAPKPAESKDAAQPKDKAAKDNASKDAAQQEAPRKKEPAPLVYAKVSADPTPTLNPRTFLDTLRAAEQYQAYADAGGWEPLPTDLVLKPGTSHPAVPSLRHHLTLTGDLPADAPPSDRLDPPLVAALTAFQARHGLPETGLLGRQTIAALNVPASVRQRQLAASAQRLMGSNFPFGERYVVVNIPSAVVEAVEKGQVARRYVAVVGSPDKATPSVETRITDVNFNPTWTVPISVVKNEIIPRMRKEPGYLAKNHIRILGPGGVEVDPTTLDWNTNKAANYTLRQDPGFDNSLGQVRIDMPNRHAVYMHDTPSKSLFGRSVRFHSHGCVRVGQVKEFVGWLLQGTEGPNGSGSSWGPIEIETGIADGERRDIKLPKPVPVTFVYLTGYATPDGRAHFRDDIYGLDTPGTSAESGKAANASKPSEPIKSAEPTKPGPARPAAAGAQPRPAEARQKPAEASAPEPQHTDPTTTGSIRPAAPRSPKPAGLLPPGLVGRTN
ncbi:L,D-transpeptidase family protein [Methylobacterium radiodurans]|uniref:Murein L,D-transpeptidase n=1 Tax=Methylobacterium radiodurans TaxID=2202828 RepID=A0A2U8VNG9_9HYPH|nr:L,D-transpeptidase family protein [Methylobacterium radiodurans]AWN34926.1 murein L,D-transpeptidase [Methylobacterium radiodurans]